jgi:hypothetical protein
MRRCGICGQPGHYRSTCPNKGKATSVPSIKKAKSVKAVVDKFEHDDEDYEEVLCGPDWRPLKKKKKKKVITCSVCGDEGHDADTCYYSKPSPDVLGPTIMECGHFSWWLQGGECSRCNQRQRMKNQSYEAA